MRLVIYFKYNSVYKSGAICAAEKLRAFFFKCMRAVNGHAVLSDCDLGTERLDAVERREDILRERDGRDHAAPLCKRRAYYRPVNVAL